MQNFLQYLYKNKSIVIILLCLPMFGLILSADFVFNPLPSYKYIQFEVSFQVPGTISREIERKVVKVSEKVFNGLPSLLNLESFVDHESAKVVLTFKKGTRPNEIQLFIQEKMDRLKVMLPPSVKQITTNQIKRSMLPDFVIEGAGEYTYLELKDKLHEIKNVIKRVEPEFDKHQHIKIRLLPKKMAQAQIPIDQIWKTLTLSGLAHRLGAKDDVSYFLDSEFDAIEKVQAIIVGARGQRIVRLKDVATIFPTAIERIDNFKIWFNKDKTTRAALKAWIQKELPKTSFTTAKFNSNLKILLKPMTMILIIVVLQIIFFLIMFRRMSSLTPILFFDVILSSHFLYWLSLYKGEITLLDFMALVLLLIFGTICLSVLLGRIRVYFLPSSFSTFIQRTLSQSIYFSLMEYLPAYITIFAISAILSTPILLSEINLPSQEILKSFLFGVPVLLVLLTVLPMFTPLAWIKDNKKTRLTGSDKMFGESNVFIAVFIFVFFIITPISWYYVPYGVKAPPKNAEKYLQNEINSFRSYKDFLPYQVSEDLKSSIESFSPVYLKNRFLSENWINNWEVTPSGMRFLPYLDVQSFKMAINDISQQASWAVFKSDRFDEVLSYDRVSFNPLNFANILVSSKDPQMPPMKLGVLLKKTIQKVPEHIFRVQLKRMAQFKIPKAITGSNFLYQVKGPAKRAPITKHWFAEYKSFLHNCWIAMLFIMVILSLFFNSFYRGILLVYIGISMSGFIGLYKIATGSIFHLDSIWLSWLPLWLGMSVIILLSRSVDIERLRGNDKREIIQELEGNFFSVIKYNMLFIIISFAMLGVVDRYLLNDGSQLCYEMLLTTFGLALVSLLASGQVFKAYYIFSEEFLNKSTIFLIRIYYHLKNKIHSKVSK
ncbi:MAG: efflux RND transporter permease subunit [Bacteriovoracaceae bacterium]|nr:efflux RND transporter permease subunit [Bacteriovoracaceae bacterium]